MLIARWMMDRTPLVRADALNIILPDRQSSGKRGYRKEGSAVKVSKEGEIVDKLRPNILAIVAANF